MATKSTGPADETAAEGTPDAPTAPPAPPTAPPAPPTTPPPLEEPVEPKSARDAVAVAEETAADTEPAAETVVVEEVVVEEAPEPAAETVVVTEVEPVVEPATTVMPTAPVAERPAPPPPYTTGPVFATEPVSPYYQPAPAAVPPVPEGNRGFGALMALIASIVFAGLYLVAGAGYFVVAQYGEADFGAELMRFLAQPTFYLAVAAFLVAFLLLAMIGGRVGWWYWVLFGFVGAALVYGGAAFGQVVQTYGGFAIDWAEVYADTYRYLLFGPVILAFVIGRELIVWFGAGIAKHGRTVTERNVQARADYESALAAEGV